MTQRTASSRSIDQLDLGLDSALKREETPLSATGAPGESTVANCSTISGPIVDSNNNNPELPIEEHGANAAYAKLDTANDFRIQAITQSLLICGSADDALDRIPTGSVQTVVTSPPYWSLRDYEVDSQIGRDESLPDYVATIVQTFDRLRQGSRRRRHSLAKHWGCIYFWQPQVSRSRPKEPGTGDVGSSPDTRGAKAKGSDWYSLEARLCAPSCRLVDSFGSNLGETKRVSRVRAGPPYLRSRNNLSALEESKLLL